MISEIKRAILVTFFLAVILCGFYPLSVWVVGNLFFHDHATGGIVNKDHLPVGAKLIGQSFSKPEYFHGRPSAAGNGYDAANSSGSNLGPTNKKLISRVQGDVEKFLLENPTVKKGEVPVEMVTASGSGLDPHISPESAFIQAPRVAQARKVGVDEVKAMIQSRVEGRFLGVLGEPVVNVLLLNLDLDQKWAVK